MQFFVTGLFLSWQRSTLILMASAWKAPKRLCKFDSYHIIYKWPKAFDTFRSNKKPKPKKLNGDEDDIDFHLSRGITLRIRPFGRGH